MLAKYREIAESGDLTGSKKIIKSQIKNMEVDINSCDEATLEYISEIYLIYANLNSKIMNKGDECFEFDKLIKEDGIFTEKIHFEIAKKFEKNFKADESIITKQFHHYLQCAILGNKYLFQVIPSILEMIIKQFHINLEQETSITLSNMLSLFKKFSNTIEAYKILPHVKIILAYILFLHNDIQKPSKCFL